ncbi:LacI family transcriptional regulator [Roseomonas sp. NAR14]|uniref:LacI family transcriptional regulator n=1 Tax=Roseomonas acroporae TaxID=2937791 RepID=A0A9X1Y4X3_9PROT|nr:LacI family transcriptional regulator [Roseomonas acroporae]
MKSIPGSTPVGAKTGGIKEVARLAGVSPATVSRVLSRVPVSEALRERVEAAVQATGYRPNLAARRLRSRHSWTVGLIVADIRNPFFTTLSSAVEEVAYKAGLRVILCNTDEDPQKEAIYLQLMQDERVTGAIFAPTRETAGRLARQRLEFPVVLIDRAVPGGVHDAVVLDNREAGAVLARHLHAQGFRRIAGLFGSRSTTGIERHAGYAEALAALGLPARAEFVMPAVAPAEAAVRRWLASADRPDAVVASNGLLLMGVVRALRAAGCAMPDDLAVAGFDNDGWTELVGPGLTVIEQPVEAIGRTAMTMLLERLEQPEAPTRRVVLSGRCVARGSTAPARAEA